MSENENELMRKPEVKEKGEQQEKVRVRETMTGEMVSANMLIC